MTTWDQAASATRVDLVVLIQITLDDGPLRLAISGMDHEHDGATWTGGGGVVSLDPVSGGVGADAGELTLAISGLDITLRARVSAVAFRGAPARILVGFWNTPAGAWALAPQEQWVGFASHASLVTAEEDDGATFSLVLALLSSAALARRIGNVAGSRTDAAQQSIFPGDRFFDAKTDFNANEFSARAR